MLFGFAFARGLAALAVLAAPSSGSQDTPNGIVFQPRYGSIPASDLANPDDPTYVEGEQSFLEDILPPLRVEESAAVAGGTDDWGDDYLVYTSLRGAGNADFDYGLYSDHVYAACDTRHNTNDSIRIFRSDDYGMTWTYWRSMINSDGSVDCINVRVVESGGETWVCVLGIWDEPDGIDDLWLRRWHTDGTHSTWEQVGSNIYLADMETDAYMPTHLYVTYSMIEETRNLYAARNLLDGNGWVDNQLIFYNTEVTSWPAIAANADGVVSVAFIEDRLTATNEVRIKRSTNYGYSWLPSEQVSDNMIGVHLRGPDIAHDDETAAWIIVTFDFTGNENLAYYRSENAGEDWTYVGVFPDDGDENQSSLRVDHVGYSVALAYNADPGNIVYFSECNANAIDDFSTPIQVNDHPSRGAPVAGFNFHVCLYAIMYISENYDLYFDAFFRPGDSDGGVMDCSGAATGFSDLGISPNPFTSMATISLMIDDGAPVSVQVFDMSGRLINTLADGTVFESGSHQLTWDGTDDSGALVPSGVYFCRVSAPGFDQSARMALVR